MRPVTSPEGQRTLHSRPRRRAARRLPPPLLRRATALLALFLTLASGAAVAATFGRIVHEERSLYRHIQVKERDGLRCMVFSVRRDDRNQSCMDLSDPERLVFPYAQMMMAALLLQPDPERILIVGLGGGTLPLALADLFPEARIDIVEIDPAVARVAREYFAFESTPEMRVVIRDARVYVKRTVDDVRAGSVPPYDLVMLDAFNGDYIPEHLMTLEFLQEVKAILGDGGVLAANTFASSRLFDHESVTYTAAFGDQFNVRHPTSLNRVLLVRNGPLPGHELLRERARALRDRLAPIGVPVLRLPDWMSREVTWDAQARPLTDDYAPANLLRSLR